MDRWTQPETADERAVEVAHMASGRQCDLVSRASRAVAALRKTKSCRMRNARPLVSFTFDDIATTALETGAALLADHGVVGTFYVSGGLCGKRFGPWHFPRLSQLAALAPAGHEIGCHTYAHSDVQTLSEAEILADLGRNLEFLSGIGKATGPESFAYPYGSVGFPQKRVVERRFRSCRGTRAGINAGQVDLGQVLAVRLYDSELSDEAVDRLIGETVQRNGWLVFYTHDVDDPPSEQGTSRGLLDRSIRMALRQGCEVLPVTDALDRLGAPHMPSSGA